MRRVALVLPLALGLLLAPLAAHGQQGIARPRIGLLVWGPCPGADFAFHKALHNLGYVEGKNIDIQCESAESNYRRVPDAAGELVRGKVNVIVALNHASARAAHEATSTIPIVFVASGHPMSAGFVTSLAHPGRNMTGLSYYASELSEKRLELLKETVPGIKRVAVLMNPNIAYLNALYLRDTELAARTLGLQLQILDVSEAGDLNRAFSAMAKERAQAVFVLPDLMFSTQAKRIADLALQHHLPMMSWANWFADSGGLMAYSADYTYLIQRTATYVDKILKGAKPGDLPVEQASKFELVINMKTAKALGLTIPQSVLIRADQISQ